MASPFLIRVYEWTILPTNSTVARDYTLEVSYEAVPEPSQCEDQYEPNDYFAVSVGVHIVQNSLSSPPQLYLVQSWVKLLPLCVELIPIPSSKSN